MLPGSWSGARKTQNNGGFVQTRDWVPPGTEKQLLMGQQEFLFLHKAVQLTVQNINLMARYGSIKTHSRIPLCSSIPRDASVWMHKESSHILSCRVMRSAHGCCQAASALLWKEAFISMPSGQRKKKKKLHCFCPERSPSLAPCVKQVVDVVAFIVYGEKLNSCKWVILVCFNFVNGFPPQYPKSMSSHWQTSKSVSIMCMMNWIPVCFTEISLLQALCGGVQMDGVFKKSWRLKKANETC